MKKIFLVFSYVSISFLCFSQAQLVMNNDPYLVIANGAYVVLENGNANALTQTGTGGRIITEAESNILRWNITNNTGSYVVPFYDNDNTSEIPFTVAIGTAGSAGGRIDFSTYDNASWDNNTYRPSDVSNMNSIVGGANNSAKVIDRFWIADASSYGTKPTATLTFTYIDAEWSAAGNTITEGNLGAQRFETPSGDWDAYVPQGTINTAANTVTAVPAAPADFWRSWTLSDNSSPLPIEMLSFTGVCSGSNVVLKWITASESNNRFFTIEKSENGTDFHSIGTLDGAGNSSSTLTYNFTDNSAFTTGAYYRIRQTDFNGNSTTSSIIFVAACEGTISNIDVYNQASNEFTVVIDALVAGNYTLTIYNTLGQTIASKTLYMNEGFTKTTFQLENIDDAMYFVNINNGVDKSFTKKIIINQ